MTFSIVYDAQPSAFLKKADNHIASRLITKIELTLAANPVPHNAIAVVGEHGVFRIRIGYYRAVYRINYPENRIIIFKLDKRSKVYN